MNRTPGAVATQRLFFALWPDSELQQRLARVAAAILPAHVGRPVPAENLHCTLAFLGDVDADQRVCVEAAASAVRAAPFELSLDRCGFFRRPQVLWLGCLETPAALRQLVSDLGRGCAACGFPPEPRPYEVHLTIARKISHDPGRPPVMAVSWPVDRFALVQSVSEPGGVRYRPLRFWVFGENQRGVDQGLPGL